MKRSAHPSDARTCQAAADDLLVARRCRRIAWRRGGPDHERLCRRWRWQVERRLGRFIALFPRFTALDGRRLARRVPRRVVLITFRAIAIVLLCMEFALFLRRFACIAELVAVLATHRRLTAFAIAGTATPSTAPASAAALAA